MAVGSEVGLAYISLTASARDFVADIMDSIGGLGDAGDDAGDKAGTGFSTGFQVAAVAGVAAVGAAVGAALVKAISIDAANDKLAASLGLTEAESARIGGVAGNLYAGAYGESLDEVNSAVGAVLTSIDGMSSASSSALEDTTAMALNFASAFDEDVARAAASAGTIIKSGLAGDATEAFDLMTAASQKVPTTMRGDLLDASDEYAGFFADLGFSGEQTFATLAAGSAKGVIGIDKAGDAVKEFTIRSTDMSTTSVAAYDAIGLNAEDMSNRLLAGGETAAGATQEIIAGLQGIEDPAAQANTAIALFGTPLEDLGVAQVPAFLDALSGAGAGLGEFEGAADAMGETLNDNASTNLESFKRQITSTFVGFVGGKALPVVNSIASALAVDFGPALDKVGAVLTETVLPAVQAASGFIRDNQTAFTVVAGVITAIFVPALIAWGVQSLIAGAKAVLAWVTSSAASVAGAAAQSLAVVKTVAGWVLMGTQSLIQAARMAAAWLIAMGPIGWVIAAVVGLVALIIANWDTVKKWTGAAWDWVMAKTQAAWGAIRDWIIGRVADIVGVAVRILEFRDKVVAAFGDLKDRAVAKVGELVDWVTGLPGRLLSAVGNLAITFAGVGGDIIDGIIDGISGGVGKIKTAVKDAAGAALDAAKDFLGISSPSRLFRDQVGAMLPAGMVEGIVGGRRDVQAAMSSLVFVPRVTAPAMAGVGAMSTGAGGGSGVTQNIYTQRGQSEYEIASIASRQLAFGMRS